MEENKCIFCQISAKMVKSYSIYEDERVLAVLDINPATNGHVIIIPKAHYNSLYEIPQGEYLAFLSIGRAIAYALVLSLGAMNVGLIYTQELRKGNFNPHALIHAIPRYTDDTVNYAWQPKTLTEEEALQLTETMSGAIEKVKSGGGEVPVSYSNEAPVPITPNVKPAEKPAPEEKPKEREQKPLELKKRVVIF